MKHALAYLIASLLSGCASQGWFQDAEVVETGRHRLGFGVSALGAELYGGGGFTVWSRHGLAADRLELRARFITPLAGALGLKLALVGADDSDAFRLAVSSDLGVHQRAMFCDSCDDDEYDPWLDVEGAVAFGVRVSERFEIYLTPRYLRVVGLESQPDRDLYLASFGTTASVGGVRLYLEITGGHDAFADELFWQGGFGVELVLDEL